MKREQPTSLPRPPCAFRPILLLAVAVLCGLFCSSCATHRPGRDFQAAWDAALRDGVIIPDVPRFDGRNRRAGLAMLDPFLTFWGHPTQSRKDLEALTLSIGEFYSLEEIMHMELERRGLWSFAFYGNISDVERRIAAGQPLLVMVQDNAGNPKSRRYMILVGFNRTQKQFIVEEGDRQPGVYLYDDFKKIWRPVRNWVMEICPPDKAGWNLLLMEQIALARFFERHGEWRKALDYYDVALQQDPENMNIMLAAADALFNSGSATAAVMRYRHVLNLDELNARAANNLAFAIAETGGDLKEAEKLIRRALTLEPSNPLYMDTLGYILIKAGQPREAADILARARHRFNSLSIEDQRSVITRLITAYLQSNQPHLARQVLLEYEHGDPGFMLQDHIRQQIPK